jgi:hypothetical protein
VVRLEKQHREVTLGNDQGRDDEVLTLSPWHLATPIPARILGHVGNLAGASTFLQAPLRLHSLFEIYFPSTFARNVYIDSSAGEAKYFL